jgi:hypothetical protein
MRALHVVAGIGLIVTLSYIGVSWAVAGVGIATNWALASFGGLHGRDGDQQTDDIR